MLRRILILMAALLLLCIPAMAEEAATVESGTSTSFAYPTGPFTPTPEDFLGTWIIRHGVLDGALLSEELLTGGGLGSIVISADSLTSYADDEPISSFTYTIDGSTLTASDGIVMQMLARNVLYAHNATGAISIILVRSNEPAHNPFYGDWQMLMVYSYGEEMDLSEAAAMQVTYRFDAEGFHALQGGEVVSSIPVGYAGNQCTLGIGDSAVVFTIDDAGLMRGVPTSEDGVMFLIPVAE